MINFKRAKKSNRIMKALTGLKIKQFNLLIPLFAKYLTISFKNDRNVNINLGRDFILKSAEEKLFYILFYMKCYPTFDAASFFFDADRSSCCRWTHWFIAALELTLKKNLDIPKRKGNDIERIFSQHPEVLEIYIDGTERPIRRPKNSEKQKNNYSGKKKRHTIKNIIISDKNKKILLITKTTEGKNHDFNCFKDENIGNNIPDRIKVFLDNGFQGIHNDYPKLRIIMPKRKPKGKELSEKNKIKNQKISSKRVINEHAIGGVKRLRIVSDIYRNIKADFEDKIMLVACGIWNYYLKTA
jgi:hypothetical protein